LVSRQERRGRQATPLALILALLLPVGAAAANLYKVYDAALEGDMVKAFAILDSIDAKSLSEKDRTAADCLRKTFAGPPQLAQIPATSARILKSYQRYWQQAMLRRAPIKDAERELLDSLRALLNDGPQRASGSCDLDCASESVKTVIRRDGLFALTGVTSPYYELMLWKKRTIVPYRIALTERTVTVPVVPRRFVSLGWAAYATCGRSSTGGWTADDSLYAVQSAYDTTSEAFRVSYLAHEGRHFADHEHYPKLDQPELEYRAKLTEIPVSDSTTHDLVAAFAGGTGTDRSVPHHFASYWAVHDLARRVWPSKQHPPTETEWKSVSATRLRQEARRLLADNDTRLRNLGSSTQRFLPTP
jgi:hypothetical protein